MLKVIAAIEEYARREHRTVNSVVREMGVSAAFHSWKRGASTPRLDTLRRIAQWMDMSVDALVEDSSLPIAPSMVEMEVDESAAGAAIGDDVIVLAMPRSGWIELSPILTRYGAVAFTKTRIPSGKDVGPQHSTDIYSPLNGLSVAV